MCYAPGLLGYSAVKIASPTFYSLRDSRTPVIASVLTVILNLVLNLVLVRFMGYRGLALGTAVAAIFNAVSLLWMLRARLDGIEGRQTSIAFAKILAASAVMSAAAWAVNHLLEAALPGGVLIHRHVDINLSLRLMIAIAAGCITLVIAARALRIEEFDQAAGKVLRRLSAGRDQS
jgi:putative peptidoglycan lipid II flippase